jgi:predicted DCC family thiol-disulfide oxidoreductase YuxK
VKQDVAKVQPALPVLVFDGECGLCQRCVRWLQSRTGPALELLPYQELAARLPQVDRAACPDAVQFVASDLGVHAGAAGVVRALALVPGHGLPLWLYRWLPGVRPLADIAYRIVAANRGRCAGWFDRLAGRDVEPPTFTGSRRLFCQWLAVVVALAFASLGVQFGMLFGGQGIWSIADTMAAARRDLTPFGSMPTLFWWLPPEVGKVLVLFGLLSALLLAVGALPRVALATAFLCWLSLVQVGGEFLGHAGDALLLEVLALAMLLVPSGVLRPQWRAAPLPAARWLLLLLCLRVCVGTAWARLNGPLPVARLLHDQLLTQPLPSTLGLWCAQWPTAVLAALSWCTVLAELLLPWLLFGPRRLRHFAAAALVLVQAGWLASGTQGVAPLLVIGLLLLAVDDRRWLPLLPLPWHPQQTGGRPEALSFRTWLQGSAALLLLGTVVLHAFADPAAPSLQLLDRFGLGRSYRDFGFVAAERPQLVLQASDNGISWHPYGTDHAPGDAGQAPAFAIGHLPRLDWQLAFAAHAIAAGRKLPWLEVLVLRLLQNREEVRAAFRQRPFGDVAPQWVRLMLYRSEQPDAAAWRAGSWWLRQPLGTVGRPMRLGG